MSYENLATIADLYIPLLGLIALISVFIPLKNNNGSMRIVVYKALRLFVVVLSVFFLMYLDEYFGIWPRVGLDYSTHTALSLALNCFLSWTYKNVRVYCAVIFIAYLLLMLYQQYHTVMDMAVTGIVVGVFIFMVPRNWKTLS